MNTLNRMISEVVAVATSRKVKIAFMVLAIALFVFAAGAPNATIGIGK